MGQLGGLRLVAGRYRLTGVLGRGGMGTVWRADDELLGRAVAVKVIEVPDALVHSQADGPRETLAQTAGRAKREARAAGRLNHPGAVTIHDVIEEDGRFHIIMELIQAPTLAELVRAEGPLPAARVAAIGVQLLDVLDFAHAEGIVHRDVKPSNVMVLANDRVKLTDFGIAQLRGDPQLTTSGATLGSPMFMAPEQAAGASVGPAADLWSLGATMYYAVEGRVPFDREVAMAALAAIVSQPPDPLRLAGPLEPALTALLVRPPASRPDGVVLRRLLSRAMSGESASAAVDPDATVDLNATVEVPDYGTPEDVSSAPGSANNEPTDHDKSTVRDVRITDRDEPAREPATSGASVRPGGRRDGTALKVIVGVLTATVATMGFLLWKQDTDPPEKPGSDRAVVQQDAGKAAADKPTAGSAVAPTALAPLAPDAPSERLGLGSAGQTGLREIKQSDAGAAGQLLTRNFHSASNPVGGYAVGVPLGFDSVAGGPTMFVEEDSGMVRAGFEVRSYRAVDPYARLVQDEKRFAQEHAADGYKRLELTRRATYWGRSAAAWEFTWKLNGNLTHARMAAFRVGPRTYTVLYRSVDTLWLGGGSNEWPDGFEHSFSASP